jgi:hypothetical protein
MAPRTRSQKPPREGEYDTPAKARFFDAWDGREPGETLTSIAAKKAPSYATAHRWLQKRNQIGSPARRRTRKLSTRLGRRSRVSKEACEMLVSPSRNPVRNQLYEAQIEYHNLRVGKRALQRQLKKQTNNGQRRKQAYVKKKIPPKTLQTREDYGKEHKSKTIDGWWAYIFFTDEAHIDPTSQQVGYILREDGHREDSENIQQRGKKEGVKLHIVGWVNWHKKCERLEFYNDEEKHVEQPKGPPKPRKTIYKSDKEYKGWLKV